MNFEEKIEKYHELRHEKSSFESEMSRIDEFLSLPGENPELNKKLERISRGDELFVSFGDWGAHLPKADFVGLLQQRKTHAQKQIAKIKGEIEKL